MAFTRRELAAWTTFRDGILHAREAVTDVGGTGQSSLLLSDATEELLDRMLEVAQTNLDAIRADLVEQDALETGDLRRGQDGEVYAVPYDSVMGF